MSLSIRYASYGTKEVFFSAFNRIWKNLLPLAEREQELGISINEKVKIEKRKTLETCFPQ